MMVPSVHFGSKWLVWFHRFTDGEDFGPGWILPTVSAIIDLCGLGDGLWDLELMVEFREAAMQWVILCDRRRWAFGGQRADGVDQPVSLQKR